MCRKLIIIFIGNRTEEVYEKCSRIIKKYFLEGNLRRNDSANFRFFMLSHMFTCKVCKKCTFSHLTNCKK